MSDVTKILDAMGEGDKEATERLLPVVYDELRSLANYRMAREKPGLTLQATALVHEAYLRLVEADCRNWDSRNHFFMAAAEAMRRILIETARSKKSRKRGGNIERVNIEPGDLPIKDQRNLDDLLSLDEALTSLTLADPVVAKVVKLHCFAGLPLAHVAEMLGVSSRTVERYWAFGKNWLFREITGARDGNSK